MSDRPPIKVGFTGTRKGMTVRQWRQLVFWLEKVSWSGKGIAEVHQGCCVGADAEFVLAVMDRVFCEIHGHPSTIAALTDQWALEMSKVKHPPLPPLERNVDIVDAVDVMLGGVGGPEKVQSGTWSTLRYTRKQQKPMYLFWPDGKVTEENSGQ